MKSLFSVIVFAISAIALSSCSNDDAPEINDNSPQTRVEEKWDYPIKPGSEEWTKLTSQVEMINACQIPDSVLSVLSTKDLLQLCVGYPLIPDIFAWNLTLEGLYKVTESFNGFTELSSRADVIPNFMNYISKYDLVSLLNSNKSEDEMIVSGLNLDFAELLLSHKSVISKADDESAKVIAEMAAKNLSYQMNNYSSFGQPGVESSTILLISVMNVLSEEVKQSLVLSKYQTGEVVFSKQVIEEIIKIYQEYDNKKMS